MCFRKKVTPVINSKYHLNDFVNFKHRDDIYFGVISNIKLNERNEVLYDIDIAGQCPATFKDIEETIVLGLHK